MAKRSNFTAYGWHRLYLITVWNKTRKIITHYMKAAGYAQGFALIKQESSGKIVLDWA
jgi:hypothetical protein